MLCWESRRKERGEGERMGGGGGCRKMGRRRRSGRNEGIMEEELNEIRTRNIRE